MKRLKSEELVKGRVYVGRWNSDRDRCIFRYAGYMAGVNHKSLTHIDSNNSFHTDGTCCSADSTHIYEASPEDVELLIYRERQNNVPYIELKSIPQLFN